jgi:hypothetical protein
MEKTHHAFSDREGGQKFSTISTAHRLVASRRGIEWSRAKARQGIREPII